MTLLRIVGSLVVAERITNNISGGFPTRESARTSDSLAMSIQLVQTIHGATGPDSLDSQNSSDLDSSNFLWRQEFYAGFADRSITTFIGLGPSNDEMFMGHEPVKMDVRVKRRFDRSQWALVLNCSVALLEIEDWAIAFLFRGLFLTSGGI